MICILTGAFEALNDKSGHGSAQALSRLDGVPYELAIRLTDEGYVEIQVGEAKREDDCRAVLDAAPRSESEAMRIEDLADAAGLSRTATQRAVDGLGEQITRVGTGCRGSPYRFHVSLCPDSSLGGQKGNNKEDDA